MSSQLEYPQINTYWHDGELPLLAQICLASMVTQGHPVNLHTYGDIRNAPKGVTLKNASDTLRYDIKYNRNANGKARSDCSVVLFSDYFRLVLQEQQKGIWLDTDCLLLKPLEIPDHGYLLGYEINTIASAVLHLPPSCPMLRDMLAACRSPDRSPHWLDTRRRYVKRTWHLLKRKPWHLGVMGWGIVGPIALTRLVPKYHLQEKVQPMKAFYPVDRAGSTELYQKKPYKHILEDEAIRSIHFYDKTLQNASPIDGSFLKWAHESVSHVLQ